VRRLLHRLLTIVSLLLFIATTYLWIRSHRVSDLIYYTRWIDIDPMNIIEEGYQYSSANSGLSFAYRYSHMNFRSAADSVRVRGYLRGARMDGKFRTNWIYIPWRQYGGANGLGLRETILGFRYVSQDSRDRSPSQPLNRSWIMTIPWPLPFLIFSILPAFALRRFIKTRREARRRKLGHCLSCGYNLRQLTSSTCPECGAIHHAAAAPAASPG
jgi:hypothetical protein